MKYCPCFLHFHLILIQFCTTIYWLILNSMKTDKINTILCVGHKWFLMCSFYIDCVIRVKFGVRNLQRMLLNIYEFHENLCRKAILFYVHNWNYIYVCTMKACGIIKANNCKGFVLQTGVDRQQSSYICLKDFRFSSSHMMLLWLEPIVFLCVCFFFLPHAVTKITHISL